MCKAGKAPLVSCCPHHSLRARHAGTRAAPTAGGMFLVRSSASTWVSFSSEMKVSAHVWQAGEATGESDEG